MQVYAYKVTIEKKGTLILNNLPINAGETVEVIVISRSAYQNVEKRYPFWGQTITYLNPTDPVTVKF